MMDAFQKAMENLIELLKQNGVSVKGSHWVNTTNEGETIGIEYIDFSEHDAKFKKQIDFLNNEISKYRHALREKELESKAKMPCNPIEVAQMLMNVSETTDQFGNVWNHGYDTSQLRQIAEHLIVYCNHNEDAQ